MMDTSRFSSVVKRPRRADIAFGMAAQLCGERAIASSRASLGHILDDPSAPVPLRKAAQWSLSSLEKDSP